MGNNSFKAAVLLLGGLQAAGCVVQMENAPTTDLGIPSAATKEAPVIVGQLNWLEAGTLPSNDARRVSGRPVALLWLPAAGARCTGFMISPDVLMTNHHCVSSQAEANGAYAVFDAEVGVPDSLRENVDCSTFVGANAALDFGLLRCTTSPGNRHGVAALASDATATNAAVYVVHQNCDYYSDPNCVPEKKVSPGKVVSVSAQEYTHDGDTLGGSSGSAMFDAQGRVVGLHHLGIGGNASGRGTSNSAVRMDVILPVLRRDFASIFSTIPQGGTPPPVVEPPPANTDPTLDALEPNNDTASATTVTGTFSASNLFIAPSDRDMFKVVLTRTRTLRVSMNFSHAAGDLDLYVYRAGTTNAVASSAGTGNTESIATSLRAGTYYVMALGYQNATGAYSITIQ